MGWWDHGKDGTSFVKEDGLVWGDGPADAMDGAIFLIEKEFHDYFNRKPTRAELIAGLLFSINVDYPEDEDES
jgi:hypothetical protein